MITTIPNVSKAKKLSEYIKNKEVSVYIDCSGSTAGIINNTSILNLEKKYSLEYTDRCIYWDNTASIKCDFPRDGTEPSCIFNNDISSKLFDNSKVIVFMTDGQISDSSAKIFYNKCLEHNVTNKHLIVCYLLNSENVSCISSFIATCPNIIILSQMNNENLKIVYKKMNNSSEIVLKDNKLIDFKIYAIDIPKNYFILSSNDTEIKLCSFNLPENITSIEHLFNEQEINILIQNSVITGKMNELRIFLNKIRDKELNSIKNQIVSNNKILQERSIIMSEMVNAYNNGDKELQLQLKEKYDKIKDLANIQEKYVNDNILPIKRKWESIRAKIHEIETSSDKFNINQFTFSSNRAQRASDTTNDIDDIDYTNCIEIDCIIHLDKGPFVIWLNDIDPEQNTNDFAINFPLMDSKDNPIVENPVCGYCANEYLKCTNYSVYRSPISTYIPSSLIGNNLNIACNNLCKVSCGGKSLSSSKLLLLKFVDSYIRNMTYSSKDLYIKFRENIINTIWTSEQLDDSSKKVVFSEMLVNIFNHESILRQPFSAVIRLYNLCIERGIIVDITSIKNAIIMYIMIYHGHDTKKDLYSNIYETRIPGIPIEYSYKTPLLCNIMREQDYKLLTKLDIFEQIEKIFGGPDGTSLLSKLLYFISQYDSDQKKPSELYKKFNSSNLSITSIFDKYKKFERDVIPKFSVYNGQFSGPSKLWMDNDKLYESFDFKKIFENNNRYIETLRQNHGIMMKNIYGSVYPTKNSSHTLLHVSIAKTLESKYYNEKVISDQQINDVLSVLVDDNYGNIYDRYLTFCIIKLINNFHEIRTSKNYYIGNESVAKSYKHKLLAELDYYGITKDTIDPVGTLNKLSASVITFESS